MAVFIDSSAETVTVYAYSPETIDGVSTKNVSTQWQSLTIQSNGEAWFII